MPAYGIYELVIQFDQFKNVDLFRQGLYYIRTSFFTVAAAPYLPSSSSNATASSTTKTKTNGKEAASPTSSAVGPTLQAGEKPRLRVALPYHMLTQPLIIPSTYGKLYSPSTMPHTMTV
jgi:hypothetical protein